MDAIAHELHTSRSSVSRLLSHARATGLVEIQMRSAARPAEPHRAGDPRAATGRAPTSFPCPTTSSDVDRLERVALSAARILGRFVDSNHDDRRRLGLDDERDQPAPRAEGHAQLRDRAAQRRRQRAHDRHPLRERDPAPVRRRVRRTRAAVPGAGVLRRPGDEAARSGASAAPAASSTCRSGMDVALFGLGSPFAEVPSHVYPGGYLERADYEALSRDGAVGDVATVFYREDGSHRRHPAERTCDRSRLRRARACAAPHLRRVGPVEAAEPPRGPRRRAHHRPHRRRGHGAGTRRRVMGS